SASAQANRYRVPDAIRKLPQEIVAGVARSEGLAAPAVPIQVPGYLSLYQVGFDASWEIDLFGGARRAVEAADDLTQAALAGRRGGSGATLGEPGADYAALRGAQARLALARRILDNDRTLLELAQSRAGNGLASELDVARARAQLETSTAQLPLLD